MAYDFPTNPATGTIVTTEDGQFEYDGEKWMAVGSSGGTGGGGSGYLPLTGGTLTGPLTAPHLDVTATGDVDISISRPDGSLGLIYWKTGASNCWRMGANDLSGLSDFIISRYSNFGGSQSLPVCHIRRNDGMMTLYATLEITGGGINAVFANINGKVNITGPGGIGGLTMGTGTDVLLSRDPTQALHAATKQYVDTTTTTLSAEIEDLRTRLAALEAKVI